MKKLSLLTLITAIFLVFSLCFASCGNEEGGGDPELPVLFEDGLWCADVGTVTAFTVENNVETATVLAENKYVAGDNQGLVFRFSETVDLSAYTKVEFYVESADCGWHGGMIYYGDAQASNEQEWNGSGLAGGKLTFIFADSFAGADLTEVSGFNVQTGNPLKVTKIVVGN